MFAADGSTDALSVYDISPLAKTLEELVDFDLINRKEVRYSIGAVNLRTGNSVYFDNHERKIGPEHVLASAALPPGLPPVIVDGEPFWDGGLVSNTPLWYVLDDSPRMSALILQVDLFSAQGEMPENLDQVLERAKDIQYSSKTRFNTTRVREIEDLRLALHRVLGRLPRRLQNDPDVKRLAQACNVGHITIAHLINRRHAHSASFKDYEFSRATMLDLWASGRDDVRTTISHPEMLKDRNSPADVASPSDKVIRTTGSSAANSCNSRFIGRARGVARSSAAAGLGARHGARRAAAATSRCLDGRGIRATDDGNTAQRVKGLPGDAGGVGDPVFVGTHIAAVGVLFRDQVPIRRQKLRLHRVELGRAFDLEAEMIDAGAASAGRDGEVDARIVQHPFGVIVFA
jgi:predicted acylesterase/phospholipase RssA